MCIYVYILWDTVGSRLYTLSDILHEEISCLSDAIYRLCICIYIYIYIYIYGIYCMN